MKTKTQQQNDPENRKYVWKINLIFIIFHALQSTLHQKRILKNKSCKM
jgi:hypothetical protein